MEASVLNLLCYLFIATCYYCGKSNNLVQAIESPNYTMVRSESDFEIRPYNESSWISAPVRGTSFNKSTTDGFHRLYQYIHGANMNSSKLAITAPVLTSIASSATGNDYIVRFYVSAKYLGKPPQPNPELKLQLDKWKTHCMAVRKFAGFARHDNINNEFEALFNSLTKILNGTLGAKEDKVSFTIAQYNSSRHHSGRLNEVWINVSEPIADGCTPSL